MSDDEKLATATISSSGDPVPELTDTMRRPDQMSVVCFENRAGIAAFQAALVSKFGQMQLLAMSRYIRPENIQRFAVDLFKVPHHGSKNNTSKELLQIVPCKFAVFSSNGAHYEHPDKEAVARVIKYAPKGVELVFNCRSKFNDVWDSESLRKEWSYSTRYGPGDEGISIDLL